METHNTQSFSLVYRLLPLLLVLGLLAPVPLWARPLAIALVQMKSGPDQTANLARIHSLTAQAARQGAEIICFPELSVTGYDLAHIPERAQPVPGPASHALARTAQEFKVTLLAGLAQRQGDRFYISQLVVHADGRVQTYRKTHPGKRERRVFSPGEDLPVFPVRLRDGSTVTLAVAICYDLHFPELAAAFSLKGAQILFAPHASPVDAPRRLALWDRYLGARAYDNTLFVAACNHLITQNGEIHGGGAGVWGPATAHALARNSRVAQGILHCELDLDALDRRRRPASKTFFLKDRRPGLYGRLEKPLSK